MASYGVLITTKVLEYEYDLGGKGQCRLYINLSVAHYANSYIFDNDVQRGTCIKGLFWPPLEPKTKSCYSPISSYWFVRRIAQA